LQRTAGPYIWVNRVDSVMPALRPHALEAVMDFQVCKTHLDFLALVARFFECRRAFKSTHMIASVFVYVAGTMRCGVFGQHLDLRGHGPQSRVLAMYRNLFSERMRPVVFKSLPIGQT
jgi:hypothetical protein